MSRFVPDFVRSPKGRIILAAVAGFVSVSLLGAYASIEWYHRSRYLKRICGSPEAQAWRFFAQWLVLAVAVALVVSGCQAVYEWLLPKRKVPFVVLFSLAVPLLLTLSSLCVYLPDSFLFPGAAGPGPMQELAPAFLGIPILILVNLLRFTRKPATLSERRPK